MAITKGDVVKVEYEGRFLEGEIFDSTEAHGGEPIEFQPGSGMLVPGFEEAVIGMEAGEEKEVTLTPENAYGEVNPEFIQKVPKQGFPEEAEVGMMIGIPMPNGQQIPAKIAEIGGEEVTLDLNHPLAGKTLVCKIKVISFEEGELSEHGHECDCGDEHSHCHDCDCEEEDSVEEDSGVDYSKQGETYDLNK